MFYEIISKENCKDCKYVIELLNDFNLQYTIKENTEYEEQYINDLKVIYQINKYPIIFKVINGEKLFIGSYYELYKKLYKL